MKFNAANRFCDVIGGSESLWVRFPSLPHGIRFSSLYLPLISLVFFSQDMQGYTNNCCPEPFKFDEKIL